MMHAIALLKFKSGSEAHLNFKGSVSAPLVAETSAVRIIADGSELYDKCCAASNIFDGPDNTTERFLAAGRTSPPAGNLPGASYLLPLNFVAATLGFSCSPVVLADRYYDDVVAQNIDPCADIREAGVSEDFTRALSDTITLIYISAYHAYDADSFVDADFNALDILNVSGGKTEQNTLSREFRLSVTYGQRFNYVEGANFFDQELNRDNRLGLGTAANLLLTDGLPTSRLKNSKAGLFLLRQTATSQIRSC